jgi:ABC-type multidrug transport system fused ATPase/permease subunit
MAADEILVLDRGGVVERGDHASLWGRTAFTPICGAAMRSTRIG